MPRFQTALIALIATLLLTAIGVRAGAPQQRQVVAPPGDVERQLLDRYCVTCHNQKLKTAGLTLDTLNVTDVSKNVEGRLDTGTFKRQLETASLLRRLMAEQGLPLETQADDIQGTPGVEASRK